jgi:hypothetical protein
VAIAAAHEAARGVAVVVEVLRVTSGSISL